MTAWWENETAHSIEQLKHTEAVTRFSSLPFFVLRKENIDETSKKRIENERNEEHNKNKSSHNRKECFYELDRGNKKWIPFLMPEHKGLLKCYY